MRRWQAAALALLLLGLGAGRAERACAFGSGDRGTSGAQFLKLPPGARAAAMGEAFAAVADDAYAVHFNPAGLAAIKGMQVGGAHNSHFQGVSHNFGVVAVPVLSWRDTRRARDEWGVLALSITNLSVGDIERRGLVETDQALDTFGARDFAYTLGYGIRRAHASFGGAVKLIDQKIDAHQARGLAFDGGAMYELGTLRLAAGFRNAGGALRFRQDSDDLPFVAYLSSAYRWRPAWLFSFETRLPRDNSPAFSLGGQYTYEASKILSAHLRGGYNSANGDADGFGAAALGAGVDYKTLSFDFAWVPFGDLGSTFRYSILIKFE